MNPDLRIALFPAGRLRLKPAYVAALLSTFALAGCAAFSPDGGMNAVADVTGQTIGRDVAFIRTGEDAERAQATIRRLLSRTLSADTAVQVALLNNKGLQAAYNVLALAETELVEQSLPPNPTFAVSRSVGWSAHVLEQVSNNRLIRPQSEFLGETGKTFVPIEAR